MALHLTSAELFGHYAPAATHLVAGFCSPRKAAKSRNVTRNAAVLRLVSPFLGGLGGEPQGSPVRFPGLQTRPVPPSRFAAGVRLINLNESETIMTKQTKGAPALVFQSTQLDIIARDGQQWLRLLQIGDALGYPKPHLLNRIYQKHAAEFAGSMTALVKLRTKGGMQEVRIFSLRGAHLLGMFARTEKAAEFRRWVLDILEGQPVEPSPVPALPKARYHYPRNLLNQPYFMSPGHDRVTLHLSMLADTTQYVSPLMALLNQLRSEGHEVTAPFDEAAAMRMALIQADKDIEAMGALALKARFKRSAE